MARLLRAASAVKIWVSGRSSPGVSGEQVCPVPHFQSGPARCPAPARRRVEAVVHASEILQRSEAVSRPG